MSIVQQQVDETDRLLDELDLMARSKTSNHRFFDQLLSSLQLLLSAESTSIVVAVSPGSWIEVARCGVDLCDAKGQLVTQCIRMISTGTTPMFLRSDDPKHHWFAVPVRKDELAAGCILLTFSKTLPSSGMQATHAIASAFSEILSTRQLNRLEQFYSRDWTRIQHLAQQVAEATSMSASGEMLVNQLVPILSASRISIAIGSSKESKRMKLLSVSAVPRIDEGATLVTSLLQIARKTLLDEQPVVRQEAGDFTAESKTTDRVTADGTFKNLLGLKFHSQSASTSPHAIAIVFEWTTREEMLEALPAISQFLPMLCLTWEQNLRWLRVPHLIRVWGSWLPSQFVPKILLGLIRPMLLIAGILTAFWLLSRPYSMTIEADSVLEPISRRSIYANVDGFLDQLFVEDGQKVVEGQKVAKLRSPILDLQIEEANGQINAIAEKRNGLRVAINQVSPSGPDSEVVQTRIAAEIMLLEMQEKHIRDKWNFLREEQKKLSIQSPIDGVVVSRNLRTELESRPLRRGDTLFNIVDLQGDWQLNIRVADRDIGYLMKHYGEHPTTITFVFDSIPGEQFPGEVQRISTTLENPQGTGGVLHVYANLDQEVARRAYMGANARVFFSCGQAPVFFVWCRPLIEFIQRRLWHFAPFDKKESR